jgi:hypothetical protein
LLVKIKTPILGSKGFFEPDARLGAGSRKNKDPGLSQPLNTYPELTMRSTILGVLATLILLGAGIEGGGAQERQQRRQRTEAEARAQAEANRAERARIFAETGERVELIPDYVQAAVGPVPDSLGLDPFYKKYVDANGIPVVSSEKAPDAALLVVRDIITTMLLTRPDLRASMIERGWRTGVIAETEMTMDIPEYMDFKAPGAPRDEPMTQADRDYHANRSRGMGGNPTTGAEENLLGYPGTRYWGEHIFVHEFAHAIHSAIRRVDPGMAQEIEEAYEAAMAAGKYIGVDGRRHYGTTNAAEYWAEGVQWWFFSNYGECFTGNIKVESPESLEAYDPALFELLGRVFNTHHILMDVYHARSIRPVNCGEG